MATRILHHRHRHLSAVERGRVSELTFEPDRLFQQPPHRITTCSSTFLFKGEWRSSAAEKFDLAAALCRRKYYNVPTRRGASVRSGPATTGETIEASAKNNPRSQYDI